MNKLDKKNSSFDLKIKVLEVERKIKEKKQEKEKSEDRLITVIVGFFFCVGAGLFLFFSKTKVERHISSNFLIILVNVL